MSRVDQYDVAVSVDGEDIGTFDKMSGGEIDSEETTYKPGAMAARISLGGSVNIGNVTVSTLYDLTKIHPRIHQLVALVGKAEMVIRKQPLDVNGHAFGKALTY